MLGSGSFPRIARDVDDEHRIAIGWFFALQWHRHRYLFNAIHSEIVDRLPPSIKLVDVLTTRIGNRVVAGRYDGIRENLRRATDLLDDVPRRRRVLMWSAWQAMVDGEHPRAQELIAAITNVFSPEPDTMSDLYVAVNATAILLDTAAAPVLVANAAQKPWRRRQRGTSRITHGPPCPRECRRCLPATWRSSAGR